MYVGIVQKETFLRKKDSLLSKQIHKRDQGEEEEGGIEIILPEIVPELFTSNEAWISLYFGSSSLPLVNSLNMAIGQALASVDFVATYRGGNEEMKGRLEKVSSLMCTSTPFTSNRDSNNN